MKPGRLNIAVLFARTDSAYKNYPCFDVYDIERDATNYCGGLPIIAHPPCRAWGRLSHMANPRPGERALAVFSLFYVRQNGGVVEHPTGSRLWNLPGMPIGIYPDQFGGFYLDIDQWDFGHSAHKGTRLYVCGTRHQDLPALPPKNMGIPARSIAGNVKNTTRCTTKQREETPVALIKYLADICGRVQTTRKGTPDA